jgi:radical SAM protein (TIGR01212 family)
VSLDGGFTCPNVDGTVGAGGCRFCSIPSFSPSRRREPRELAVQFEEGTRRLRRHDPSTRWIAYFQPATNTHDRVERLRGLYESALALPDVVGLAIGTRPDCLPEPVLDLLSELSQRTWLSLEIGLQSAHDASLAWLRRGHDFACFEDAVQRCHRRGIPLGVHLIVGLPCETREQTLQTAAIVARMPLRSVKLHNLYAAGDTLLGDEVLSGRVTLPTCDEYVQLAADFLERLNPDQVIDRISGDAPPEYLIGPRWCLDKAAVRRAVEAELERRDSWQGKWAGASDAPAPGP